MIGNRLVLRLIYRAVIDYCPRLGNNVTITDKSGSTLAGGGMRTGSSLQTQVAVNKARANDTETVV